jgi:hypothetical protein
MSIDASDYCMGPIVTAKPNAPTQDEVFSNWNVGSS